MYYGTHDKVSLLCGARQIDPKYTGAYQIQYDSYRSVDGAEG